MVDITRRKWTWIGHVLRKDSGDVAKESLFWKPEGKRQRRRRPRITWRRSAEKELKSMHLTWIEIRKVLCIKRKRAIFVRCLFLYLI